MGGLKVCAETAQFIRGEVRDRLEKQRRLSKVIARILRDTAKDDAEMHKCGDPFSWGGGRAVELKREIIE